jgi:hypothetical protein
MDYFMPIIMTVLAGIAGWAVQILSKSNDAENELKELQITKEEQDALTTLGKKVWWKIEEDFKLGDKFKSKLATFETMVRSRVPDISAQDMNLLNKSIAGEFNADKAKVITAVKANISNDDTIEMPPVYVTPPVVSEPEGVLITPDVTPIEAPAPVVSAMPIILAPTQKYVNENGDELVLKSTI